MAKAKARKSSLPKLIERYYADLAEFTRQNVLFEMGTRHAFHRLMADAGKEYRWTLIAEQEKKVGSKTIRPDGTFKDEMNLVRGFWEAKDTADKLEAEIEKKRKAGYPFNNNSFQCDLLGSSCGIAAWSVKFIVHNRGTTTSRTTKSS